MIKKKASGVENRIVNGDGDRSHQSAQTLRLISDHTLSHGTLFNYCRIEGNTREKKTKKTMQELYLCADTPEGNFSEGGTRPDG